MSADASLGAYLRGCRERSGLSVEAVSAGSRIVSRLVDALEADRPDLLPAPVYVRGFIRAYCDLAGADAAEALRMYEAQAGPTPPVSVRAASPPLWTSSTRRRWWRVAAGALLVAALGGAAVVVLGRREPDAVASRGAGGRAAASRREAPAAATTEPAAARVPSERVLVMRATDTTWVRVQPDGAGPVEETLAPGTMREWRSPGRFHITVGNAGGVELELDGRALPALGAPGQVVRDATVPGEPEP